MNLGITMSRRWFAAVSLGLALVCVGCEKPASSPVALEPSAAPATPVSPPVNNVPVNSGPVKPLPDPSKPSAPTTVAPAPATNSAPPEKPEVKLTARELLERTVKAYASARGYSDLGYITQSYVLNGQPYEQRQPLTIAYEKPNKLRLECYNVKLICDGQQVHGTIRDKEGILELAAPATLTQDSVVVDETMQAELNRGFGGNPLQLLLLFSADPLAVILGDQTATLLPDLDHAGRRCNRVKISSAAGEIVLWLDAQTFVVRRLDYPLNELKKELAKQGEVKQLTQYADFVGAELDPNLGARRLRLKFPRGRCL